MSLRGVKRRSNLCVVEIASGLRPRNDNSPGAAAADRTRHSFSESASTTQLELDLELFLGFAYDFISTLLLRKFSLLVRILMKGMDFCP